MADRMIVMNGGIAEQIGSPLEVYEKPRTLFAAQFIGSPSMNIVDADAREGRLHLGGIVLDGARAAQGPVKLGLRPEHVVPDPAGPIEMQVQLAEPLGANTLLHGTLTATGDAFTANLPGVRHVAQGGEVLQLSVPPEAMHLFDGVTGERLS